MEYIENGDVIEYVQKASMSELVSLLMQSAIAIIEMATKYNVSHGDLNCGNILVTRSKPQTINYTYSQKVYTFQSCGIEPVFLDFGRGSIHSSAIPKSMILNDILLLYSVLACYISEQDLRSKFNKLIIQLAEKKRISKIFDGVMKLFTTES